MCTRCDGEIHAKSPCHDREVWDGNHFTAVPPTITINPETLGLATISKLILYNINAHNLSGYTVFYNVTMFIITADYVSYVTNKMAYIIAFVLIRNMQYEILQ